MIKQIKQHTNKDIGQLKITLNQLKELYYFGYVVNIHVDN